jgi:hypothetical protein
VNVKRIFVLFTLGLLLLVAACSPEEALGVESEWMAARFSNRVVGNEIVFEPGDKCSLNITDISGGPAEGDFAYKIIVQDDTYENYMIVISTLHEGYTIEDLKAHQSPQVQPPYTDLWHFVVVGPDSVTLLADLIAPPVGELYITCMIQGPDEWKILDTLGPIVGKSP